MHESNGSLSLSFPVALREEALAALSVLPESPRSFSTFSAMVAGEQVLIPFRIYHDPGRAQMGTLSSLQCELLNSLFTRHHDGFVRQYYLERIIGSNNLWVSPFVIQLIGESVVEILEVIQRDLSKLDRRVYERFLIENPQMLAIVEQRVMSYWNCYYRRIRKTEYVGFQLIGFLKSLVSPNNKIVDNL